MNTSIQKKLTELAREFDLREVRVQTEDRRDYFIRFENGILFGCWDWTLPADKRAQMEMMQDRPPLQRSLVPWVPSRRNGRLRLPLR